MPEEFDPRWEYWQPSEEMLEATDSVVLCDKFAKGGGISEVSHPDRYVGHFARDIVVIEKEKKKPQIRRCYVCDVIFKMTKSRKLTCSRKCGGVLGNSVKVAISHRRAEMLQELMSVYGSLRKAAKESGMNECHASRLLKSIGKPAGYKGRHQMPKQMFAGLQYTLEQATELIRKGARFGDVYPQIPNLDSREQLRYWFCYEHELPNQHEVITRHVTKHRPQLQADTKGKTQATPTGNSCPVCSSMNLVRTGTCVTCQDCGYNGGCG